jgi:hypothetical protein
MGRAEDISIERNVLFPEACEEHSEGMQNELRLPARAGVQFDWGKEMVWNNLPADMPGAGVVYLSQ